MDRCVFVGANDRMDRGKVDWVRGVYVQRGED